MKCVVQRVRSASVRVADRTVAAIGPGMLVLAAVVKGDDEAGVRATARKLRDLRIFADPAGKMNLDLAQSGGEILAVSQFTLAGSIDRGRRPSFEAAEEPGRAKELFETLVGELGATGIPVRTGHFREMMLVTLENDGPVTFVLG
ncbi:MAG TPA: D-aminoacyl-tRNA deacylase [Thermoanaerobaculia bacterium]|nr:D-aminoacyl-tRNA deacylase [Thermoanaerobaculia bacterium]